MTAYETNLIAQAKLECQAVHDRIVAELLARGHLVKSEQATHSAAWHILELNQTYVNVCIESEYKLASPWRPRATGHADVRVGRKHWKVRNDGTYNIAAIASAIIKSAKDRELYDAKQDDRTRLREALRKNYTCVSSGPVTVEFTGDNRVSVVVADLAPAKVWLLMNAIQEALDKVGAAL